MPERVIDFAWLWREGTLISYYRHEVEGNVVPAVAIEGYGLYEQFYSSRDPEAGLAVLRRGLGVAECRGPIAEDLGYILRDEGRREEAISMFTIAIDEGPSSHFTLLERAALFDALGDRGSAERDRQQAEDMRKGGRLPWWQPFRRRT